MTFNHARQILSAVKAVDPEILTVMGGPHVTFCAQETLETFARLYEQTVKQAFADEIAKATAAISDALSKREGAW